MSKLPIEDVEELQGGMIPLGDYHFVVKELERGKDNDGLRQYTAYLEVVEPASLAGRKVRDWFRVGTADDPQCKEDATAKNPENWGIRRLKLLLNKSHTPTTNDDEQFMTDIEDNEVGAQVRSRVGNNGKTYLTITYEFPEDIEPQLLDADTGTAPRRGGKKGPAQAARAARGRRGANDDDLGEEKPDKNTKGDDDGGDEKDDRPPRRRSRRDDDD